MPYCPNCCALLRDPAVTVCPKCGVNLRTAAADKARRDRTPPDALSEWIEENPALTEEVVTECSEPSGGSGPGPACPQCGDIMGRHPDDAYSFDLLGGDVNVSDVQVMSMVIRKRAVTQVLVEFEGWSCPKGHKFFSNYRENTRELCPVCRSAMARFGTTIVSCKKCGINLTKDKFVKMPGRQLMEDEGWEYLP